MSHASLIVGTLPVLIAFSSTLFLRERLSASEWVVLLLSPAGVLAIAFSAGRSSQAAGPHRSGRFTRTLSMCAAAGSILVTKHLMANYDSLHITVWMLTLGAVLLFVGMECFNPVRFHFSLTSWGAAAAQGLLATAGAYLAWNWGLERVPASRAGVFLNLEPLVGTLLGVSLLHEHLGPVAILGGVLIIGPAVYFSRKPDNLLYIAPSTFSQFPWLSYSCTLSLAGPERLQVSGVDLMNAGGAVGLLWRVWSAGCFDSIPEASFPQMAEA